MCGFIAAVGLDKPFSHTMLAPLRRRGPGRCGWWQDGQVVMAHARLDVFGLGDRGAQPAIASDTVLVWNGEIYNWLELRRFFCVDSLLGGDTDLLLSLWARYRHTVMDRLAQHADGVFAIAAWDRHQRTMTLVRDQLGARPLYWWHDGQRFAAASTIAALLGLLPSKPGIDPAGVAQYARYQFTFGDHTMLQGVHRVEPGTSVTFHADSGKATVQRWDDLFPARDGEAEPDAAWLDGTAALVDAAVRSTADCVVPWATTCSGGLDSSLVTRIAAPDVAWHCNYTEPECNETRHAQAAVHGTVTRLHVVNAHEHPDLLARVDSLVQDLDDPSVGSVVLPMDDMLERVAERGHKVLLTGTGGDELAAGYQRVRAALGLDVQASYAAAAAALPGDAYDRWEALHVKGAPHWFAVEEGAGAAKYEFSVAYGNAGEWTDTLSGNLLSMLRFDQRHFLQALLLLEDRMCGRWGIEGRPALLCQSVVRRFVGLKVASLLQGPPKAVLAGVAQRLGVPQAVVDRRDKMGFTTPVGRFVNEHADRIRERITSSRWRHMYRLDRIRWTTTTTWSREVWGLVMLDAWLNRYA